MCQPSSNKQGLSWRKENWLEKALIATPPEKEASEVEQLEESDASERGTDQAKFTRRKRFPKNRQRPLKVRFAADILGPSSTCQKLSYFQH